MRFYIATSILSLVVAFGACKETPTTGVMGADRPVMMMPAPDSEVPDIGFAMDAASSPRDAGFEPDALMDASNDAAVDAAMDAAMDASNDAAMDAGMMMTPKVKKSLVLILDGVRPDAFAHANTPNYDALINGTWQNRYRGAYTGFAQNLDDASTVSGPNHAAAMTGATATQHGVTSNGNVGSGRFDTYRHYLRLIEDADSNRNTAYLFTWGTDRQIVSGADYIVDSSDEGNTQRAVDMLAGTHSDNAGLDGSSWASGTDPDAIFLFLDDPDGAGHGSGFEISIARYISAMETCDGQLGRILTALAARSTFADEDWQIVMTSDHGGYERSHGADGPVYHTIPFLIASPQVEQGRLPSETNIIDVVPTVLQHMNVGMPNNLNGQARGATVLAAPPSMIGQDLARYYRFEGNLVDTATGANASIGMNSDSDPATPMTDGKFGGYLQINDSGGGSNNSSYITIPKRSDLALGNNDNLTVSLWFRSHGAQGGDPVIIGNKNWNSGGNPGWLLLSNEGADNSFGANISSSSSDRLDLEDIDYSDTNWWFLVLTFDASGQAVFYAGSESGGLRWMGADAQQVGDLSSSLPINVGQDGTGSYTHNADGDVDDLAIWRRALSYEEVLRLYAGGRGVELQTQL